MGNVLRMTAADCRLQQGNWRDRSDSPMTADAARQVTAPLMLTTGALTTGDAQQVAFANAPPGSTGLFRLV